MPDDAGTNVSPSGANASDEGGASCASSYIEDKELEAIFLREFGSKKQQEDRYQGYRNKSVRTSAGTASAGTSGGRKNVKGTVSECCMIPTGKTISAGGRL